MAVGIIRGCGGKSESANKEVTTEKVVFPLEENYTFSIMTRVGADSEQDFSKKALVQRMEKATNVTVDYQAIQEEQFDDKYKLALSKKDMPDVVTKMYIKPYDILGYAEKRRVH